MIPDEVVDRVRETADIVEVIGEYVSLKRTGADFRGPCPFHHGTKRNFSVSPKRGRYHCFVCGEGGDVFSFMQKHLGLDFTGAVRAVGEKFGIEVREIERRPDQRDEREPLWEACATAADYFRRQLWEEEAGGEARAYLEGRGITREVADRFGMGFAPREIGLTRAYLNGLGFDDERLLRVGLLVKQEEEWKEPRPRFRGRLIFPIYDVTGHTVGFGGRLIGPGEPKYLNSPETEIFSKGKLLYGLNWAKLAARREDRLLVVEGYFDVVRLAAAGVEEVVAPLGTALTEPQAKLVRRYTRNVYLLYDSDEAGLKATFRSGDELLRQGAAVQVVTLPEGEDPDTFVARYGPDALRAQLGQAVDIFERKIQILQREGWLADLRRKRRAIDKLLPTIRATADVLTRDLYLARAAEVSGIGKELLQREVEALEPEPAPPPEGAAEGPVRHVAAGPGAPSGEAPPFEDAEPMPARRFERRGGSGDRRFRGDRRGPPEPAAARGVGKRVDPGVRNELELLRMLARMPGRVEYVTERVGPENFRYAPYRAIFAAMIAVAHEVAPEELPERVAEQLDPELGALFQNEVLVELGELPNADQVLEGTLIRLRLRELREELARLQQELARAPAAEQDALIVRKKELGRERAELEKALKSASAPIIS